MLCKKYQCMYMYGVMLHAIIQKYDTGYVYVHFATVYLSITGQLPFQGDQCRVASRSVKQVYRARKSYNVRYLPNP